MFRKLFVAAAVGFAICGGALAQTDNAGGMLDNKEMMKPFYADDGTTMKTGEEFSAAIKAMNTNDRDKVAMECRDAKSPRDTFCTAFNEANKPD